MVLMDIILPTACDIPNGSRCTGDIYEECRGDGLIQINCAEQEERCISDNDGACCEAESQLEEDLCANNYCLGHGWCEAGHCICDPGYVGDTCGDCAPNWQLNEFASCEPMVRLYGTPEDDEICGDEGEITRGHDGNDTLKGFGGEDYINGNAGDDYINGNTGRYSVPGGAGSDEVKGGQEDDVLFGGGGNDELSGGRGNDRLIGGDGDGDLLGSDGYDRYLLDGLGDDLLADPEGGSVARCAHGVSVIRHEVDPDTNEHILNFNSGGTLSYYKSELSSILGCNFNP